MVIVGNLKIRSVTKKLVDVELPVGYENFMEVIDMKLDFVDKSLFIKEVLDDKKTKVAVITRPRRFGKTLNLSMLHHFLAAKVNTRSTRSLFDNLKIAQCGAEYMEHQGKYPVIFMTFKDLNDGTYDAALNNFRDLVGNVYGEHRYLLESSNLYDEEKEFFRKVLQQESDELSLQTSLQKLTLYLFKHHGVKPWLLIDEYDTPVRAAFVSGYYDPMTKFMRNCLGRVLKTNSYLYRSVVTGILKIAKESIFSGVNNLQVYTLLENNYSQYFGFTEEEVTDILKRAKLEDRIDEVREWYNGYNIGDSVVYNPWSVVNYVGSKGKLDSYWIGTSDNALIKDLLIRSSPQVKDDLDKLMQGISIFKLIEQDTSFGDVKQDDTLLWGLLVTTGYLKVIKKHAAEEELICELDIPNYEVRRLYQKIIAQWLSFGYGINWYYNFLDNLLTGNIELFRADLTRIMEETVGVHDTARNPESFYHGLLIGITSSLYKNKDYEVRSNRDIGCGRYDILIYSKKKNCLTIVIKIQRLILSEIEDPLKIAESLEAEARKGMLQIDQQKYVTEAIQGGMTNILKIAIAFSGNKFEIAHEYVDKI